ncbi:type I glutamate--ammonia ligase [Candidatus Woesearchaeota archaeon]|nr:type I glutamate--ammonia ligase [Candidatus Woesearchaeota archaeon]|tara:strand:+ start:5832 stop:7283 length:1452 start_codon:yes stop_codon:yes gene_type:complete
MAKQVLELLKSEGIQNSVVNLKKSLEKVKIIDFKFTDLPGLWQHFSVPVSQLTEDVIMNGIGFDGSSIRGFKDINESDMLVMPDIKTSFIDPFSNDTLSIIGNIKDPETNEMYSRDPRFISQKAQAYLVKSKIADKVFFGPEAEFFVFDSIRYEQKENLGYYFIDSKEGSWNTGNDEENNTGYKPRFKEGYFPVPPTDSHQNLRNEMVLTMEKVGIKVECHHHEVGTAGQGEIDMGYARMVRMADQLMMYKYVVKNIALKHGKTATFMPKPLFNDNGSGMHTHQSLWKNGKNLFHDKNGYAQLSKMALHYIGGLLEHAPALCALIAPTTNSYKRLVPGFEAPVNLVYSKRNRSAAVRIPVYSKSSKSTRVEFRTPDPSCNAYLAFSALLMAGLDGIKRKLYPGKPLDKNIYSLSKQELKNVKSVPISLPEAMDALENDHQFLLQGDVFTKDVIETWIEYKRENEIDPIRLRPHPWEFHLYYDI